jgi:hypothetical protein
LIEGSLGFAQLGKESFGILGNSGIENFGIFGGSKVFGREFEQPVNTREASKIKVNLFIDC